MKSRLTQDERTSELELRVKELEKQVANLKLHLSNSPTLANRNI